MTAFRLASLLDEFAAAVWRASGQATLLIGLVLVLQWTFRRQLAAGWRYWLWLIVLARLVCPTFPASPTSLFHAVALLEDRVSISAAASSTDSLRQAVPHGTSPQPPAQPIDTRQPDRQSAALPAARVPDIHEMLDQVSRRWPGRILVDVWALVAAALLFRTVAAALRLRRYVRSLRPVTQPDILETFDSCLRTSRVGLRPQLLIVSAEMAPAAGGLLRPYLLLPQDLVAHADQHSLRFILLHELAHLRNGDLFVNWALLVVRALHWFNPAIWFACARIAADRELACDTFVLSHTETTQRVSYGHLLIDLVERLNGRCPSPGTLGLLTAPALIETRIRQISGYRPPRAWQSALGIVLLSALGLCGLTSARAFPPIESNPDAPQAGRSASASSARDFDQLDLPASITVNVACVGEDGFAIAGAEVILYAIDPWTLESKPAASQRANAEGICRFDAVSPSDVGISSVLRIPGTQVCSVAAKAAGRASAFRQLTTRNVTGGAAMVALVLPRAAILYGRVTDAKGVPIRGASVYRAAAAWKRPIPGIGCATTDEGGFYEMTDIAEWAPSAEAGQTPTERINARLSKSSTVADYFVLHVHHPNFGLKEVHCHGVPGLTKVQMEEAGLLAGRVVDVTTKKPLAGVSLFVEAQLSWKEYGASWGVTDQNGAYRIAVAAHNDYFLFVYKDGFMAMRRSHRPQAIPAKVVTPVDDIEMVQTSTIRGRIVDRTTKNPMRLAASRAVKILIRSSKEKPFFTEPWISPVHTDGTFAHQALMPGRAYSLSVESADPMIKSQSNVAEVSVRPGETVETELAVSGETPNR